MTNPAINLLTENDSIGFSVDNGVTLIHVNCFVFADEDAIVSGQTPYWWYWKVIKKGAYSSGAKIETSQKKWQRAEDAVTDLLRFLRIVDWADDNPVFDSGIPADWLLQV